LTGRLEVQLIAKRLACIARTARETISMTVQETRIV